VLDASRKATRHVSAAAHSYQSLTRLLSTLGIDHPSERLARHDMSRFISWAPRVPVKSNLWWAPTNAIGHLPAHPDSLEGLVLMAGITNGNFSPCSEIARGIAGSYAVRK
jgi:hypothetical protein